MCYDADRGKKKKKNAAQDEFLRGEITISVGEKKYQSVAEGNGTFLDTFVSRS